MNRGLKLVSFTCLNSVDSLENLLSDKFVCLFEGRSIF
jgi:hypothetical protein